MNILHYTLGLPPYRSGGLTKYSLDLIKEQSKYENIYLLFPGEIGLFSDKNSIVKYKDLDGIKVFEIKNPLPVPLLDGISNPKLFMKSGNKEAYKRFLVENEIDILHIHTLMGLHKELLEEAKNLNIKIFFTSHDYFGLCSKVNFINNKGEVCEEATPEKCLNCNFNSQYINKIKILQSPMYRFTKNIGLIAYLKKIMSNKNKTLNNDSLLDYQDNIEIENYSELLEEYKELSDFYKQIFSLIDKFIFNSSVSKEIYSQYISIDGVVEHITHADIKDNRKLKKYSNEEKLKVSYLGPMKKYKGFDLLMEAMNKINLNYKDKINLNFFGDGSKSDISENIKVNGKYSYSELENIFDETDVLIVPSIWYETFGFIALEAISYGVPVIVTEKVGSKDIISKNDFGFVIGDSVYELEKILEIIIKDRSILSKKNENILKNKDIKFDLYSHYLELKSLYLNVNSHLEEKI